MTKPTFTTNISAGNIIQILVLIVSLTAGWFAMKNETSAAISKAVANAAELSDIDARVRVLERSDAQDSEQLRTFRRDIEEIKQGQRDMNNLLRQLLQRAPSSNP